VNGGGGCEGGGGLPGNGREPDGGAPWGARIAEGGARPFPGGGAPPAKGGAAAREISMLAKGAASDPGTVVGFCAANGGGGLDGDEDAMDRRAGRRSGSDEDGEETRERKMALCRGGRGSVWDTRPGPSDHAVMLEYCCCCSGSGARLDRTGPFAEIQMRIASARTSGGEEKIGRMRNRQIEVL
jgi:hypothetical protein